MLQKKNRENWQRTAIPVLTMLLLSVFAVSQATEASAASEKAFVATVLQFVDISKQYDAYNPYLNTSPDRARIHVGLEKSITEGQLDMINSLPPEQKGAEFFSLAEIKEFAPKAKALGFTYLDYDLEPGRGHSPSKDLADPVGSVKEAAEAAHQAGLLFNVSPSKKLTIQYGEEFAKYVDMYHIQAQSLQHKPAAYLSFVKETAAKLKNANLDISITVQLSATRGAAPGLTLQETFEENWNNVRPYVDGISIWFSPSTVDDMEAFASWFDEHGRYEEQDFSLPLFTRYLQML